MILNHDAVAGGKSGYTDSGANAVGRRQLRELDKTRKLLRAENRRARAKAFQRVATMVAATGLLATTALPSYGYAPDVTAAVGYARGGDLLNQVQVLQVNSQTAVDFRRGDYKPADASEFASARVVRVAYNGPVAADYVKKPRFSAVTSENVMKASAELVGVPYVFGGSTPGGIDCSGYVLFVFSQFGLDLPHSVYQQAKLGVKIKPEEALPGDIVVFNDFSHNGIYAGNGNFYHAPRPGDRVKLAPIFTDRYYFVRFLPYDQ